MPTYEYDLDEMNDLIDLLDRSIEEISAHCDGAQTTVAGVLADYSGTAATELGGFHDAWQSTARRHLEAMRAYRTFVATARDNYADARRKNLEMFG